MNGSHGVLSVDGALQRLCRWGDAVDSAALQVLRDNWEEVFPILLHQIESVEQQDAEDDTQPLPLFHAALFLCAERKEEWLSEALLARCAEPNAENELLQFIPLWKLGSILAECGTPGRLLEWYGDSSAPVFCRIVALNGLFAMGLGGCWPSLEAWLAGELARLDEIDSEDLAFGLLTLAAADFPDLAAEPGGDYLRKRPTVNVDGLATFELLVAAGKVRQKNSFHCLGTADEELVNLLDDLWRATVENTWAELVALIDDPASLLSIIDADGEQELVTLDGVGRNEPCPCGSGKKFKKCCFGKAVAQVPAGRASHLGSPVAAKDRLASDLMQAGYLYEGEEDELAQVASWVSCASLLKTLVGNAASSPSAVEQKRLFVGYEQLDQWIEDFCNLVVSLHLEKDPICLAARPAIEWFYAQFQAVAPALRCKILMAHAQFRNLDGDREAAIHDLREALLLDVWNPLARVILAQHIVMRNTPDALDEAIALLEEGKALSGDATFDKALAQFRAVRDDHGE